MKQQRVLAIHDISCFGRCSLTVALPILSAVGIETTILPNSILSTHTGGFTGYTFRDLTDDIEPIVDHWKSLDLKFDAIYTGYLGSLRQIDLVKAAIDKLSDQTFVYVDPAMADNGKLYALFNQEYADKMKELCAKADMIVPNITEACYLSDNEYVEGPYTKEYIEKLLNDLNQKLGVKKIILTGVNFNKEELGAVSYDDGVIEYAFAKRLNGYFHGTGDIFGSVALGCLLKGKATKEAMQISCDFVVGCIERTIEEKTDIRFGVDFENGLRDLANTLYTE